MTAIRRHIIVIVVSTILIAALGLLTRLVELPLQVTSSTNPDIGRTLMLRTDFADDAAWESLRAAVEAQGGEFRAFVRFVDDRTHAGLTVDQAVQFAKQSNQLFVFVADRMTLTNPDRPVLVVDASEQAGRTFRVVPASLWSVENNLALANMDFEEFAAAVDADGIFRGFRRR